MSLRYYICKVRNKYHLRIFCTAIYIHKVRNSTAYPVAFFDFSKCSIIGGKYPGMDMVSFGPTIRGAHAPGESVEVQSVEHCWRLLQAILTACATGNLPGPAGR